MKKDIINEAFLQKLELLNMYIKDNVAGAFGGNHQSKKYGSSSEFADFREYIPGDDIRRIDWNVFARFEKLFLKLYLDERQMHTKIYIDSSISMKGENDNKATMALKLAATFAFFSIKAMDKVSIYYIDNNRVYKIIDRIVGKDSFYSFIGALNEINFDSKNTCISDAIMNHQTGYGNGMSIIISDFLTNNNYFNAISHLRSKHRDVLCIQLLDDDELNPKFNGKNIFYDSENNNMYKKNINKDVVKAYYEALNYITSSISSFCKSREATYLLVNATSSLDDIILNQAISKGVIK